MNIAIIPARGGSKRIPRKNIKEFCGKPMIAWSIDAAKASELFEHIIVSTDDEEIAAIAVQWGAEVPFMRPKELADDYTTTRPVINHAIETIVGEYGRPDYVCVLYSTAPFLLASDLREAYRIMLEKGCAFTFSATTFAFPIQRAFKITPGGVVMFNAEHLNTRSQDLEEAYHDAGQFYWGRTQAFLDNLPTYSSHGHPFIVPRYRVQDIDTMEDWEFATAMFSVLKLLHG
jgi:pseudaminic acid cytidylyltransferase